MQIDLKALTVVIVLSAIVFEIMKPIALLFSTRHDFIRRRNVWFALTAAAFLSPTFWWFTAAAVPLLVWAGRRDSNTAALYLFLFQVIPPVQVNLPTIGINRLFALDIYRLLAICLLTPAAWRSIRGGINRFQAMDILLLGFGALQTLSFIIPDVPHAELMHDSATNMLRRAFLFVLDVYLLYYFFSRCCSGKKQISEAMASFCIVGVVMAAIAIFESARHWLLYAGIGQNWGVSTVNYIMRAGVVRAAASSGNPVALGYILAIALGFWLYLRRFVNSLGRKAFVTGLLVLGLIAAYSRGPWVGALLVLFGFALCGQRAMSRLFRIGMIAALIVGVLMFSPIGSRIVKVVPFLGGNVDESTITYRERLLDRSVQMVQEHPWLGNPDAYQQLHDLRQGVGVIDFVNTYADVAVFYGLVGLALFVSFIVIAFSKAYRVAKIVESDVGIAMLAASIAACILGTMLMIYTTSFIFAFEKMFYVLAGLATAISGLNALGHSNGMQLFWSYRKETDDSWRGARQDLLAGFGKIYFTRRNC